MIASMHGTYLDSRALADSFVESSLGDHRKARGKTKIAGATTYERGTVNILIVDDEPKTSLSLRRSWTTPVTASSGPTPLNTRCLRCSLTNLLS